MKITVLPVSGGGFPSQLALLTTLPKVSDVVLGSSGGNIAAYLGMASDYDAKCIDRILKCLKSRMLLKSWWPEPFTFIPSWVAGYSRGSSYDHGDGVDKLFHQLFTEGTVIKKEIWTGTTDCSSSRSQLFCNRSTSILKTERFICNEYNSKPLRYLNGNIKDISTVSLASASIPTMMPPVLFEGKRYTDGGTSYSSPLTPMSPILRGYRKLHIDYLNSFDAESESEICSNSISSMVKTTSQEMMQSMILNDRAMGIEIIRNSCAGDLKSTSFSCCPSFLKSVEEFRKSCDRSLLELYPKHYHDVDITDYCPKRACEILWMNRKEYRCRIWWVGDKDIREEYPDIYYSCQECCNC